MTTVTRQDGCLSFDGADLTQIADEFGTPAYVYSSSELKRNYLAYRDAFGGSDTLICYAMKANSNLAVLQLFKELGAGFDIVSGGELQRALAVGCDPKKIVFSGVGKSTAEMVMALEADILCFNIESTAEMARLNEVAGLAGKRAPVSFRVNPDVDAKTHPYISTGLKGSKFGVAISDARRIYLAAKALPNLDIVGMDCHIGSQLTEVQPFADALDRLLLLLDQLSADGIHLHHIDLGGGLGIRYSDEILPLVSEYAAAVLPKLTGRGLKIILEPGRSLVGNAGLLLTRIEYLKLGEEKNFAIIDAAMNDLMRPALYEAYHEIVPVVERPCEAGLYDVVGPVCESGDFLGKERELAVEEGDLLAVLSAGAYGSSMSSNYNTRPRAAEVLITDGKPRLVRERESYEQILATELSVLNR